MAPKARIKVIMPAKDSAPQPAASFPEMKLPPASLRSRRSSKSGDSSTFELSSSAARDMPSPLPSIGVSEVPSVAPQVDRYTSSRGQRRTRAAHAPAKDIETILEEDDTSEQPVGSPLCDSENSFPVTLGPPSLPTRRATRNRTPSVSPDIEINLQSKDLYDLTHEPDPASIQYGDDNRTPPYPRAESSVSSDKLPSTPLMRSNATTPSPIPTKGILKKPPSKAPTPKPTPAHSTGDLLDANTRANSRGSMAHSSAGGSADTLSGGGPWNRRDSWVDDGRKGGFAGSDGSMMGVLKRAFRVNVGKSVAENEVEEEMRKFSGSTDTGQLHPYDELVTSSAQGGQATTASRATSRLSAFFGGKVSLSSSKPHVIDHATPALVNSMKPMKVARDVSLETLDAAITWVLDSLTYPSDDPCLRSEVEEYVQMAGGDKEKALSTWISDNRRRIKR
ncbi:hypothetical protein HDU93_008813 [Gonapodya sp. JEL0774]|nr:hypothetical protein HDU93_008813 [Gonapodya sp. JEL0774]